MNLIEGDILDIIEKDGIVPVAIYPEKYVAALQEEIRDVKNKLATGEQPVFDNVEAMFEALTLQK